MLLEWLSDNQELLTWLSGGIATAAGGIWTVVKLLVERRDKASGGSGSSDGGGASGAAPPTGNIHVGDNISTQQARVPKAALALGVVGLAILAYAAFFSGSDCIQGSVVGGDISNSTINVTGNVSGDCE